MKDRHGSFIKPMPEFDVEVYKIHPNAKLPAQKSNEAAGYDICTIQDFTIHAGQSLIVGTGLSIKPPPGFHTEIFLRSSMAAKHNITLINSIGLIDRDYSGPEDELKLVLYKFPITDHKYVGPGNTGVEWSKITSHNAPVSFKAGDRVAQLVFRETKNVNIVEVDSASNENRGGLGSTGR